AWVYSKSVIGYQLQGGVIGQIIIEKLGDWCPGILPNQEVFFRISLEWCLRRIRVHAVNAILAQYRVGR
ncbi:hypothetical protein, partial [Pseudomonas syringae group genomosp. 3]|uniref:hypothetical protein n=1 Tax=Pseudomonas syringae group genomosp. 3 TaxID=251701 RepID=UPI0011C458F1